MGTNYLPSFYIIDQELPIKIDVGINNFIAYFVILNNISVEVICTCNYYHAIDISKIHNQGVINCLPDFNLQMYTVINKLQYIYLF